MNRQITHNFRLVRSHLPSWHTSAGFSLVELSVVLVIVAILAGAVMSTSDLLRVAQGQRLYGDFVASWRQAYLTYQNQIGINPGDNPVSPIGAIQGPGGSPILCNDSTPALSNEFLAHGIQIPDGSMPGLEDQRTYQDSHGVPHFMHVCMMTVPWSVQGLSVGSFSLVNRPVLRITGLTVELAMQFDTLVDGLANARFGSFRSVALSASTGTSGDWPTAAPIDSNAAMTEVDAYLNMGPN